MSVILNRWVHDKDIQSLSGNTIFAALGFLSFVILTRSFEKEVFGEWVLYVTAAVFIEMFRFGLTKMALVRFLSGADKKEQKKLMGSNYMISLALTLVIAIILITINLLFRESIEKSGYVLFFKWYPLLAFINLPYNHALSVLQAWQRFDKILYIKFFNIGSFVLFLALNYFFFQMGILSVLIAHLVVNLLSSVLVMAFGWDGIEYIQQSTGRHRKKILNFGKYAMGTLIGSNLLKSMDTFILGLSPFLGSAGVAMYSIPMKLTEVLAIPLTSLSATSFPRMSKASIHKQWDEIRKLFYTYSGAMTYFFMLVAVPGLIFAEFFVVLLGGRDYAEMANVFRVFCIYALFLPIDRFAGVALDSINKPANNMYKVLFMNLTNITGDIIAIFVVKIFYPNITMIQILMLVAMVTILMTIIGQIIGFRYLNKELPIRYHKIFYHGWLFFCKDFKWYFIK
ncbi:MAG: MATE family efflux transporter [Bacteroidales bacterium]